MERVLIIGSNGAGKSTFSYRLAEQNGLPLVHLDQLYWHGNWEARSREEFAALALAEAQKPRWIIEGNNVKSLHQRLPYADTVFWFEFPPPVCLCNILKRVCRYRGKVRSDMPDQCVEKLDLKFLNYAWNFNRTNRARITALLKEHPHLTVVRFTSRRQVREYLANSAPKRYNEGTSNRNGK